MKNFKEIAREVNGIRNSDGLEVVGIDNSFSLLRFANSTFHQNVENTMTSLSIRSRYGKKTGIVSTERTDKESFVNTLRASEEIAKISPEDPELPPLYNAGSKDDRFVKQDFSLISQEEKAKTAASILKGLSECTNFGSFYTGKVKLGIFNSEGTELSYEFSHGQFNIVSIKNDYAIWYSKHLKTLNDINIDEIKDKLYEKFAHTSKRTDIEPGKYTVILEPLALSDILGFMTYLGFSAKAKQNGFSFLIEKTGKQLFSKMLNITDDPEDESLFPMKFDFEGVSKHKMELIRNGVPMGFVYDRKTALKDNVKSTGHCISPFGSFPMPAHLKVASGSVSYRDMIKDTPHGILITRFHYTNIINPNAFDMTGMTRDGTFLIENGKITAALPNLRFFQNMIEALSNIEEISTETEDIGETSFYDMGQPGLFRVPYVKIRDFNFIQSSK